MGRTIEICGKYLIILRYKIIIVYNLLNYDVHVLKYPSKLISSRPNQNLEKDINIIEKDRFGVLYVAVSLNTNYLAIISNEKEVVIWNTKNWIIEKCVTLIKRPVAVQFSNNLKNILVADKTGDVYSFSLSDNTSQEPVSGYENDQPEKSSLCNNEDYKPVLGHLSMLLDIWMTYDGKYLITCDRDEKIRISSYPNCYNIHTYCLGHEEFVYSIQQLPNQNDRLLSTSGDGTVRLWNFLTGDSLGVLDTGPEVEKFYSRKKVTEETNGNVGKQLVAVTKLDIYPLSQNEFVIIILLYRLPFILFYNLKDTHFTYLSTYELPFSPYDLKLLENGELLLLRQIDKKFIETPSLNPLVVLKILIEQSQFVDVSELTTHHLIDLGNKSRDLFIDEQCCLPDVESLYKQRYDNITEYKKRKEERLNAQEVKKGKHQ